MKVGRREFLKLGAATAGTVARAEIIQAPKSFTNIC